MQDKAAKNRAYLNERYRKQREEFIAYLGGRCNSCQSSSDLQIDHMNPKHKRLEVGRLWPAKMLHKAYEELERCQLLCRACHEIKNGNEQRGVERGWSHGTYYGYQKKACRCFACYEARNAPRRRPGGYGPHRRQVHS